MAFTFRTGTPASYWSGFWKVTLPTSGGGSTEVFYNRKYHPPTMSYHYWLTSTADPTMSETTPPNPKAQYIDHVIVKVSRGN